MYHVFCEFVMEAALWVLFWLVLVEAVGSKTEEKRARVSTSSSSPIAIIINRNDVFLFFFFLTRLSEWALGRHVIIVGSLDCAYFIMIIDWDVCDGCLNNYTVKLLVSCVWVI